MFKKKQEGGAAKPAPAAPAPAAPTGVGIATRVGMSTGVKVLIGVLVSVFIVGGGIAAFMFFRVPPHQPQDPQTFLFQSFEQLILADDVRFTLAAPGETLAALAGDNAEAVDELGVKPADYTLGLTLDLVQVDEKRMDAGMMLSLLPKSGETGFELNTRLVDEDLYFQLARLNFPAIPFALDTILGKWVDLNFDEVQEEINSLLGTTTDEESLNPEDYVYPDVKKTLERVRDIYLAAPALDLTLVAEDQNTGLVTLQVESNDQTKAFIVDAIVEAYVTYLEAVDVAIKEKDAVGETKQVTALKNYKSTLVDENGAKGELLRVELDREIDLDDSYGPDSPLVDVQTMLTLNVNTGHLTQIKYVLVFKDGVVRPPIVGMWGGYNAGNVIQRPIGAMSVEEFFELIEEMFDGGEEEVIESDVEFDVVTPSVDTDGDALSDFDEMNIHKTDINKVDTDGDALDDFLEVNIYKTDPLNADTDGDGFADGVEVENGYNPLK